MRSATASSSSFFQRAIPVAESPRPVRSAVPCRVDTLRGRLPRDRAIYRLERRVRAADAFPSFPMEETMRAIRTLFVAAILGSLAAGCGDDIAARPDDQGSVTLNLTLAPTDARCAVVTVTPAMGPAVVRQFPLAPQQPAVFSLTGLPTGNVTISEQVFTVACNMTGGQMPTWIGDPVMVTLQAGVPVNVTFNLRRADGGGQVNVSTNFPQPPGTFQEFDGSTATAADNLVLLTTGPDDAIWFTNLTNNSVDRMSA